MRNRSRRTIRTLLALTALFAALAGASPAVEPGGRLAAYLAGPFDPGRYTGRLVCVGEGLLEEELPPCKAGFHNPVLLVDDREVVHILPATPEIASRLGAKELQGRTVLVTGRYYETRNAILVLDVALRES